MVKEGNSDTNNKQGRQWGNGIFNAHIYYTRIAAVAISITIFARESLTSTREDGSAVRYSAYFPRPRVEYNEVISRLKKVYAKSEIQ